MIRQDIYDGGQNALIAHLLEANPPIVATLEAVPDEVIGWTCRTPDVTHYVYVKHAFRRTHVALMLVHGAQFHTHQTRAGELLFKKSGSLYNPFILQGATPCPKLSA